MTEEKLNQLSNLESNAQYLMSQRQNYQNQLLEVDSALEEIDKTSECHKIIGSIMVKTDKSILKKELDEKKELLKKRLQTVEEREKQLRSKAEQLQKEVMEELEKKGEQK